MKTLVLNDLTEPKQLSSGESAKIRGGLVRIFENHVLTTLGRGGVEAAGEIQEARRKNDIFSW